MKKLIPVVLAVSVLSGCVVNQPTPATQVTAVASAPVTDLWCQAVRTETGKPDQQLAISFIRDQGDRFTVINAKGKVALVSPQLIIQKPSGMQGYNNIGLLFSKGTGQYVGFYGVFRYEGQKQFGIAFDCR